MPDPIPGNISGRATATLDGRAPLSVNSMRVEFKGISPTRSAASGAAESVPVSRLAQGLEFEAQGVSRARVEAFLPGQSTQRLSVRAFKADGTLAEGRTVLGMAGSRIDNGLFGSIGIQAEFEFSLDSATAVALPAS